MTFPQGLRMMVGDLITIYGKLWTRLLPKQLESPTTVSSLQHRTTTRQDDSFSIVLANSASVAYTFVKLDIFPCQNAKTMTFHQKLRGMACLFISNYWVRVSFASHAPKREYLQDDGGRFDHNLWQIVIKSTTAKAIRKSHDSELPTA